MGRAGMLEVDPGTAGDGGMGTNRSGVAVLVIVLLTVASGARVAVGTDGTAGRAGLVVVWSAAAAADRLVGAAKLVLNFGAMAGRSRGSGAAGLVVCANEVMAIQRESQTSKRGFIVIGWENVWE